SRYEWPEEESRDRPWQPVERVKRPIADHVVRVRHRARHFSGWKTKDAASCRDPPRAVIVFDHSEDAFSWKTLTRRQRSKATAFELGRAHSSCSPDISRVILEKAVDLPRRFATRRIQDADFSVIVERCPVLLPDPDPALAVAEQVRVGESRLIERSHPR